MLKEVKKFNCFKINMKEEKQIQDYINGKLSKIEILEFEKMMQDNLLYSDQVKDYKNVQAAINISEEKIKKSVTEYRTSQIFTKETK